MEKRMHHQNIEHLIEYLIEYPNLTLKINIQQSSPKYLFFLWQGSHKLSIFITSTDQTSCNRFQHCFDKIAYKKTCPGGLVWDTFKNKCGWPGEVRERIQFIHFVCVFKKYCTVNKQLESVAKISNLQYIEVLQSYGNPIY